MKKNILLLFSIVLFFTVSAQNFTGQWKGVFLDKSTSFVGWGGDRCDYILDLECRGKHVSGFSYTYFTDGGKKYYTICKLEGFIDRKQKYIEVKETERTKTNVPDNIRNCFQVHKLTYFKDADTETIEGEWDPAPNQGGDCGYGTTVLTRRTLTKSLPGFNSSSSKTDLKKISPATKKSPPLADKTKIKTTPSTVKTSPKPKPNQKLTAVPDKSLVKKEAQVVKPDLPVVKTSPEKITAPTGKFEKRNNTVLKTIEVVNKTVKVDLYDNGEIDGDSVSLFYNGKLLLSNKKLSEKPITFNLSVEDDDVNELIMYADNLGTIPPNTALMVVTDGPKRYEVRITSDLQKSGVINFIHKPAVAAGN
jgi:hypothetical protein